GEGPALIFDIGGGSTELVLIDTDEGEPRIKCWWSAPWGVVSLTDSEGRDFTTVEERLAAYGRMRERVRHAFRHFMDLLPKGRDGIRLMGTSGTVTTLASVYLSLPSYDRRAVDGLKMPASAIRETIMDLWPAETLGVADRGIREGILRSLMARDGHVI